MRRRMVVVGLMFATMLSLPGCDFWWSSARFDARNTGFNPGEHALGLDDVPSLTLQFTGAIGPAEPNRAITPAVGHGFVYVTDGSHLLAFRDGGPAGCTAIPDCSPAWTAFLGWSTAMSSPVIAGNTVLVSTRDVRTLFAFDATGQRGCHGEPVTCDPLWTAPVGGRTSPTVNNGKVFVASSTEMWAVDAAGDEGCSGTPKVCQPLWSTYPLANGDQFGGMASPTATGDVVFLQTYHGGVYGYDENGSTPCSGTPAVCSPKWVADAGGASTSTAFLGWTGPVVDGDRVLTYAPDPTDAGRTIVSAFDVRGIDGCFGFETMWCSPQWSTTIDAYPVDTQLAVALGRVYVVTATPGGAPGDPDTVRAYATSGAGCAGAPMTCPVLWQRSGALGELSFPTVANGVLYLRVFGGIGAFGTLGPACLDRPCPADWVIPSWVQPANVAVAGKKVYVLHDAYFGSVLRVYG